MSEKSIQLAPRQIMVRTKEGEVVVSGRTAAIILEIVDMQEEINKQPEGPLEIHWKEKEIRTRLVKWGQKRRWG